MNLPQHLAFAVSILLLAGLRVHGATLSLAGPWSFRLDPENVGMNERWFASVGFKDTIRLPGCLQEQGFGNTPGPDTEWWAGWEGLAKLTPEFPFLEKYNQPYHYRITAFLQPEKHYIGAAWYARSIEIPPDWARRQISLFLERCHWETRLWIDGMEAGRQDGLAVPHEYEVTRWLTPGRHQIVLRVDNSRIVEVGGNAHSVSDQTAGTWNGIVGQMELRAAPAVSIDDLQVYPNLSRKTARLAVILKNSFIGSGEGRLTVQARISNTAKARQVPLQKYDIEIRGQECQIEVEYPMGEDVQLWDEFNPVLYRATVSLYAVVGDRSVDDQSEVTFGMREFAIRGTQFAVNGRPVFLRGNVDCAVYPQTGFAPMSLEEWRHIWAIYKQWGFNQARFHSWCPPEAAFAAADEAGIYLAPEVSEWSQVVSPDQEEFFRRESQTMLRRFGNHPSFVMMALGNESGGDQAIFQRLLAEWKRDSRRVYSIKANSAANPPEIQYEVARVDLPDPIRYQSGWPPKPENTLLHTRPPQTAIDWRPRVTQSAKPLIAHETGQFCSYPDVLNEPSKFTGYLKPAYLDIAREQLLERGMLTQVDDFVRASGKWQMELYKEEVESHFRTPGLGGFHLLQLNDFTGQNTAPVGLLDATWEAKPYARSEFFRQFCGPTVLLARMAKRLWTTDENFHARIEITHYGPERLANQSIEAFIRSESGQILHKQQMPAKDFACASAQFAGELQWPLSQIQAPAKLTLGARLPGAELGNSWHFWVYPGSAEEEELGDVFIAREFTTAVRERLASGGKVLLLPRRSDLAGNLPICFTTFYWTSFGLDGGQSSGCGLLCDPKHPAFRDFPTEFHSNWQWWELLTQASPIILDGPGHGSCWPKTHRPLVQIIDSWKINRKLAVLTEARLGPGSLAICSMDIENQLEERPAARQFRNSLLRYLKSPAFQPQDEVTPDMVEALFRPNTVCLQ